MPNICNKTQCLSFNNHIWKLRLKTLAFIEGTNFWRLSKTQKVCLIKTDCITENFFIFAVNINSIAASTISRIDTGQMASAMRDIAFSGTLETIFGFCLTIYIKFAHNIVCSSARPQKFFLSCSETVLLSGLPFLICTPLALNIYMKYNFVSYTRGRARTEEMFWAIFCIWKPPAMKQRRCSARISQIIGFIVSQNWLRR